MTMAPPKAASVLPKTSCIALGIECLRERMLAALARHEAAGDTAPAHVQDAVGVEIDLRHFVGDQQDRDAARCQLAHYVVDALLVADVDADGRAIENENLGVGGKPLRQDDPLLIAAG